MLCARVEAELRRWARRHRFAIERIDIDTDPTLQARYVVWVPVTVVGQQEFHYELDQAAFLAALKDAREAAGGKTEARPGARSG